MADAATAQPPSSTSPVRRFSWPMRLFLGFLLLDMVFHSLACLSPYRDWLSEIGLERFPKGLPTRQEMADLQAKESADEDPLAERLLESLDSTWDYFKPWPSRKVRRKLTGPEDAGKFALCWLASRLSFFEALVGVSQRWTMFSPNAAKGATVARMRLVFRDGSRQDIRLTADPEDLTNYSHWFQEKVLDYELKVTNDYDSRLGYCNFLSHQFPKNRLGSPLERILIYEIRYRYPDPNEDAAAVLKEQSGPPDWDKRGPAHVYEIAPSGGLGRLRKLDDKERQTIQQKLSEK